MSGRDDGTNPDERNQDAPQVNPERSGIRTSNPQLDPDRARKTDGGRDKEEKKRHRPDN